MTTYTSFRPAFGAAFGAEVRAARRAAGLSVDQLAVRAGLSSSGLEKIEQGNTSRPHRSTVAALRRALSDLENSEGPVGIGTFAKSGEDAPAHDRA